MPVRFSKDAGNKIDDNDQFNRVAPAARARLERLVSRKWKVVWEKRIANYIAPVSALVRDDGKYVVTFDNWGTVGYGPYVVVIYEARGHLVRALALSDIVPADYVEALPHSVSSIQWRDAPRFSSDGRKVIIPVVIPSEDYESDPAVINIGVNLSDGKILPISPFEWDAAMAKGRKVRAEQIAYDAAIKAAFIAPLRGPKINAEREWHDYLWEAVSRLIGDDNTPSTTVLRLPDSDDYAVSETWVHDALTESYADKVALASLSEPNLVTVLKKVTVNLPDRSLSNITVYIAVSDRNWPAIVAAMQRTGAKIVQLDPTKAIPQRSERIARRYGHLTLARTDFAKAESAGQ